MKAVGDGVGSVVKLLNLRVYSWLAKGWHTIIV